MSRNALTGVTPGCGVTNAQHEPGSMSRNEPEPALAHGPVRKAASQGLTASSAPPPQPRQPPPPHYTRTAANTPRRHRPHPVAGTRALSCARVTVVGGSPPNRPPLRRPPLRRPPLRRPPRRRPPLRRPPLRRPPLRRPPLRHPPLRHRGTGKHATTSTDVGVPATPL